ncbi:MAG TPA: hypothetical protein VE996_01030 [Terriglobales bacterium]|nr:hypothetical protein [Terriglobales bacterium]
MLHPLSPAPAAALQSEPAAPQLLSIRECAARTGASVAFWRREVLLRRIRVYRLGDLVRIAEPDLAAYLAARAALPRGGRQ